MSPAGLGRTEGLVVPGGPVGPAELLLGVREEPPTVQPELLPLVGDDLEGQEEILRLAVYRGQVRLRERKNILCCEDNL